MSTLQEQIIADIDDIFFNADELAEEVSLNGVTVLAVPSRSTQSESGQENAQEHGVLTQRRTYTFRDQDLDPVPVAWEEVLLNGEPWIVEEVNPQKVTHKITFFKDLA